jgi:hypothetical protein
MNDLSLISLIGLVFLGIYMLVTTDNVDDDNDGPPDGGMLTPAYVPTSS